MAGIETVILSGGLALLEVGVGGTLGWARNHRARRDRSREQQFAVFSDFAGAIAEYRRAELARRMTFNPGAERTEGEAEGPGKRAPSVAPEPGSTLVGLWTRPRACDASSRCAVEVQAEARLGSTEEAAGSIPAAAFASRRATPTG